MVEITLTCRETLDSQVMLHELSRKMVEIASRSQWMRGYASNAIVRWLGYEWADADVNGRDALLEAPVRGIVGSKTISAQRWGLICDVRFADS